MTRQRGRSRGTAPVTDSIAHRILTALAASPDGGQTADQLLPLLSAANRNLWQLGQYADQLVLWNMALQLPGGMRITPAGRDYVLGRPAITVPAAELPEPLTTSWATPRSVPAFKPLDMARLMRSRPMRDGMDDYRDAPSLMGSTRVMPGGVAVDD